MKRRSTLFSSVSLVLAAVSLVSMTTNANAQDPLFAPAVNYGAGSAPSSVFSADFDGDDDNDLAVADLGSDNVSILLSNGDGTFASAVNYGAGHYPRSVFSADLDGDDDNDLAVANGGSNNVSILLNNGDGTFAAAVNYETGFGPYSVFSVDLDGDDDNDLAVSNFFSHNVSILLNNGDGTFVPAVNYGAGSYSYPISVFSADLDGDSDFDLAVADRGSDNISILLNNGDGTFASAVNYGVGHYPWSVFSADLDGDNDNDLAVANEGADNVSILLNNGDGTFAAAANYGAGNYPQSVFSADLDGDNDNDLATTHRWSDNVSILLNNGDGTFASAVNYEAGDDPASVFSADLDGDNDNDLAVANFNSHNVSILENLTVREPIELWVDIVGRDQIRPGQSQIYDVRIGNFGYDDAYDVVLMITMHEEVIYELNLEHPPIDTIEWDSVPTSVALDDTLQMLPIYMAKISPDSVCHLELSVVVPVQKGHVDVQIIAELTFLSRYHQSEAHACADAWSDVYRDIWESHGVALEGEYLQQFYELFNAKLSLYRTEAVTYGLIDVIVSIGANLLELGVLGEGISILEFDLANSEWQIYVSLCSWYTSHFQEFLKSVRVGYSWDPNDKAGSSGFDTTSHYVPPEQVLNYIVFFENVDSATADALDIVIIDTVDANLDWSSLTIDEMSHPDVCSAEFDSIEGVITWTCDSIMLPPDTVPPNGEGWVSFSVKPMIDLASGTEIRNRATIKFDYNPWIYAPMDSSFVINTIDAEPPSTSVDALPDTTNFLTFVVSWSGMDEPLGSGIASYTIYAKIDGGRYVRWISDTTVTSAVYYPETGHTYYFYSIARDNVGHIEDRPQSYDARTTVYVPSCCNGDGIRGNADGVTGPGGEIDVADLTYLVAYLFQSGPAPPCEEEGNVDGVVGPGGPIDVADLTYLVTYLFQSGPAPPACP